MGRAHEQHQGPLGLRLWVELRVEAQPPLRPRRLWQQYVNVPRERLVRLRHECGENDGLWGDQRTTGLDTGVQGRLSGHPFNRVAA